MSWLAIVILSIVWVGVGLWTGSAEDCRLDYVSGEWKMLKGWHWGLYALAGPLPWLLLAAVYLSPVVAVAWAVHELAGS